MQMSIVFRYLRLLLPVAALLASIGLPAAELDLSRYRGKVVVVDFWASWCGPCRDSLPWLNQMQDRYRDRGLVVVGVNVDRERTEAERFLHDVPARFEIVYDDQGVLATHYQLNGMPSSFVYGRDGKLIGKHLGFRLAQREAREAELRKALDTAE